MAKIVNCPICGKEMKKGFFGGEDMALDIGEKVIGCCEDCYQVYRVDEKYHAKRFAVKIRNYKKARKLRKLTEQQLTKLYILYRQEGSTYDRPSEQQVECQVLGGGIKFTADGRFSAMECANDFMGTDVDAWGMVRSAEKAIKDKQLWFTAGDITRLEYFPNRSGSFNGLFQKVYSYTVRFNDESQITYRPAVTHVVTSSKSFLFGFRKKAEKKLLENLKVFRSAMGVNVPIVRVQK